MKKQKPYFTEQQVDQIFHVFTSELANENIIVESNLEDALREYIQSAKHVYENACLSGVLEGNYLCTVKNGNEVAFKAQAPSDEEVNHYIGLATRVAGEYDATKAKDGDSAKVTSIPTFLQVKQVLMQKRMAKLTHALNMVIMYGKAKTLNVRK